MIRVILASMVGLAAASAGFAGQPGRVLATQDVLAEQVATDPRTSPSGDAVLYEVDGNDLAGDKAVSHIWLAGWDGGQSQQMTSRPHESETMPRWRPDGRAISRQGKESVPF